MGRVWAFALLFVLLALPLTGCWSRHELNDLSIVVGLGIDKFNDKYKVTSQIVNPAKVASKRDGGQNLSSPVVTYEEEGATVPEALARMTVKAPRRMYFAHLRMLVIGEELAREGVGKPLDFISRNRDMRTDFFIVVARHSSASQILKMNSAIDPIPSNNLYTKLETSDKLWAATGKITLDKMIEELFKEGKNPVLTGIEILGDPNQGKKQANGQNVEPRVLLQYSGMAIFNVDRMVDWLDENDAKTFNYLQNSVKETTAFVPCPQKKPGNMTAQIVRSRNRIETKISNDGQPEIDVYQNTQMDISDIECDVDVLDPKIQEELTEAVNQKIIRVLSASVRKSQTTLELDYFGFGDVVHRQNPKYWRKIKNWNNVYKNMEIRIHSHVDLRRIGTTLQPIEHAKVE
ncbi:Ger(x)C family spore germination protein [Paenibacillus thalictri]|uniref:Ger(X)C family spore germination protein n=1 Tax=Paenibacillus thalictri TaxID=2527873 RepID=A0A4Q9DXX5_9BACL|nr:Ger(x)C family spore germination protein [Paenibacillus thalictri]TBL81245.1 Ger(x)C family spore germination protein [Paenibacillus thalictri]